MTGEGKKGLRLPRLNTPGRLLGCGALLCLASVPLLFVPFVPRGVLGFGLLTVVQIALMVWAVRLRSRLWPLHVPLLILTALPPLYLISLFFRPPDGM
ncbi:hypothetical protein GCM10008956_04110 [Deinococcus arenae]|uniref:Uncharacterized protein n=1 Tax=Deinococcus arenae TaxID=1452751 RepID=A0A8H9L6H0_9DEIO|nr:hypothetical protein [Deinococcus arenae]GGM31146.1 hypothetical protein GCM10008956_04110 [Deinococcus arenae]